MQSTTLFTTAPPTTAAANRHSPPPDRFAVLIDTCKTIDHLLQIHAALFRHALHHHHILSFKLQRSYSSFGHLDHSAAVFHHTLRPNVFTWTAIIHAHAQHGLHEQAFDFYAQMLAHGVQPNAFTFSSILKSCPLEPGKSVHSQIVKFGLELDSYVRTGLVDVYARGGDVVSARRLFDTMPERNLVSLTAMITGYSKRGNVDEARLLFDGMKERDIVCWKVMIDGYAQYGRPDDALLLFQRMLAVGVKPNEMTLLSVLSACGQLGALESGIWLHSYILSNGIEFNVHLATALVDMYSKCGSLEDARFVFDSISVKDLVLWNSIIVGYAMHGFSKEALELFSEMCKRGVHPTDITFIGVLNACAHAGLVNEGWGFFSSMKDDYGIEPKIEHYGCMVNLVSRAGNLDEAYELVKNMKIEPDSVLWGTLLGASRLHGNIALGEAISEYLMSQNLATSGTYVLLSNMFAAAGNWDQAVRMRNMMKDCGVRKEPGCSSIEVNNKVHEFLAGDLSHPRSKEIYLMLEEINAWLKAHGYRPQTDTVLHDIEETEKERSLEVHSEKLAIAFGLISTQPGTAIKVVKNLRVCSDCHAVTKLISKMTGRKIVVRDRNRFHHFMSGSCSCGDYW